MISLYHYNPESHDDESPFDDLSPLDGVIREAGIYVSSNKELTAFVADGDTLIGGLYTDTDPFDFDIAVAPDSQGIGAGKALFDEAMVQCDMYSQEFGMPASVHVVNPRLHHWLFQHDFTIAERRPDAVQMERESPLTPPERLSRLRGLLKNEMKWQDTFLLPVLRAHEVTLPALHTGLLSVSEHQAVPAPVAMALADLARALPDSEVERGYLLAQLSVAQGVTYPIPEPQQGYLEHAMETAPETVLEVCVEALRQHLPDEDLHAGVPRLQTLANHWMKNGNVPVYGHEREAVWQVITTLDVPEAVLHTLAEVTVSDIAVQPAVNAPAESEPERPSVAARRA